LIGYTSPMTKVQVEVITSVQRRRPGHNRERNGLLPRQMEPGAVASEVAHAASESSAVRLRARAQWHDAGRAPARAQRAQPAAHRYIGGLAAAKSRRALRRRTLRKYPSLGHCGRSNLRLVLNTQPPHVINSLGFPTVPHAKLRDIAPGPERNTHPPTSPKPIDPDPRLTDPRIGIVPLAASEKADGKDEEIRPMAVSPRYARNKRASPNEKNGARFGEMRRDGIRNGR
jgi:hypothetical protein